MNLLSPSAWQKKAWRMNRSAKSLLIVSTNLNSFSLANDRQFAKFAKLSHYTVSIISNILSDKTQMI